MRNLAEYPITPAECYSALMSALDRYRAETERTEIVIGDLEPLCLSLIREYLMVNEPALKTWLQENTV